jgi:hypothetical protein
MSDAKLMRRQHVCTSLALVRPPTSRIYQHPRLRRSFIFQDHIGLIFDCSTLCTCLSVQLQMVSLALSIMRSFLQLGVLMFNPLPLMTKSLSLLYQTLKVFWNGDGGDKVPICSHFFVLHFPVQ